VSANTPRIPEDPTPQPIPWLTPQIRRWAYGVILAAITLLGAYGVIGQTTAPLWAALAASILSTTTALVHVPTGGGE
jgi:hypothetical protein